MGLLAPDCPCSMECCLFAKPPERGSLSELNQSNSNSEMYLLSWSPQASRWDYRTGSHRLTLRPQIGRIQY